MLVTGGAQLSADPLCDMIETATHAQSSSEFVDGCNPAGTVCRWEFDFRSRQAVLKFKDTVSSVLSCNEGTHQVQQDKPVNHPDTYSLRIIKTPKASVRISLKDKGALQKTYVFLQVIPD